MCQDPKKIRDPGSTGSKISDLDGSWILCFQFCREILWILDPAQDSLSLDPVDLGSCAEKLSLDPVDLGSCADKLSLDPVDPGSFHEFYQWILWILWILGFV
eukprot:GHVH01007837.1.p1 GENE.GHVH01007837.1~~GHVH01007837.1.p1  ORF type:complete len:102 (-),score=13.45 GHVH01007837.1:187-492(-)